MPESEDWTAVVADATVLIFLGKLRSLDYLTTHYSEVLVPPAVYEEVVEQGEEVGAADAVRVRSAIESGALSVVETELRSDIQTYDLEAGETAVLSLAVTRDHEEVLADEEAVREVARLHGLRPRGTLYFLFGALERGELGFEEFIEELQTLLAEGFYLDEEVYLEAVREARRIVNDES